jgi:hypothetical protein
MSIISYFSSAENGSAFVNEALCYVMKNEQQYNLLRGSHYISNEGFFLKNRQPKRNTI